MYEDDIQNLKKITDELNNKININNQKDKEINNLKLSVNDLRKEYSSLNDSYESVLTDLKKNINTNEKLRLLIIDLENKIDNHNNNVSGMDLSIKQQIEQLTRNSLAKKNIDYNPSKDVVSKVKIDHKNLNDKIDGYNKQKLSFSQVLPKYDMYNSAYVSTGNNSLISNQSNFGGKNNYVEITGVHKSEDIKPKNNVVTVINHKNGDDNFGKNINHKNGDDNIGNVINSVTVKKNNEK